MTNVENFDLSQLESIPMETYEQLGRWLCFQFYRDSTELKNIPYIYDIFEEAVWMKKGWADLLSGAYRETNSKLRTSSRSCTRLKAEELGPIIRKEQLSIDGVGNVRRWELQLYYRIAMQFVDALKGEIKFD